MTSPSPRVQVCAAEQIQRQKQHLVASRTAGGGWGTTSADYAAGAAVREEDLIAQRDLEAVASRLADLGRHHLEYLAMFREQLPAQEHDEVRFLLDRMDFAAGS